ncbi:dnaJ homolog subfamily C member 21 isoform X1 [Strongylocentrotus purpuratus]|uniref:DnaJ homolog subfamily C member 21 n=1 Tax=Strongylocentrotus purpuratus TaxID=7668 RepID=A0A7M7N8V0_STRPU|nr:dnaJ homolog subfamily C member 21 isoform X1 [Strongylocentrotus purpuratus]
MPEVKCHYEVLGVPRDVEDDVLKKAYRKMALKWHPDKNPDKVEECTKYFAQIQTAYGVLSDKQERAWYDKHREAILKGGFGKDYEDNFMDVMQYMTPTAYTGFGDDEKGYYSVYRDVFAKIAEEDIRYMEDEDSITGIPGFGESQSSYEEVVHVFYAYWQSYRTSRSYVWVEEFDTREAPNRRVARLIEKENKKKREAAKKEWNQQVQLLVSYAKKKDKRVQVHRKLMEEKAAEKKKLEAERRERERKERAREHAELAEQGQKVKEEMEAELKAMEATFNKEYGIDSDNMDSDSQADSLEDELDDLFCVACNKSFKSPKAFANHENSKKHKENIIFLKAQMEAEEEEFAGEEESQEEDYDLEEGDGEEKEESEDDEEREVKDEEVDDEDLDEMEMEEQAKVNGAEPQRKKLSKKQKKKKRQQAKLDESENIEEEEEVIDAVQPSDEEDDDFPVKTKLSKKQKKKRRQQMKADEDQEPDPLKDLNNQHGDGELEEEDFTKIKLSKKQKKRRKQQRQMAGNEEEEEEEEVEDLLSKLETETTKPVPDDTRPECKDEELSLSADLQERLTLEDQDEVSSKHQTPSSNVKVKTKGGDVPSSSQSTSSSEPPICHTCSSRFPTRNKLFKHVKSTGHALRLSEDTPTSHHNASSAKSSKKKKKNKGRNELE